MKRWQKVALAVAIGAVVVAVVPLTYVQVMWDRSWDGEIDGPDLAVSADPGVIERGRYLVHGPAHCSNCHVGSFEEMARADAGEPIPMRGGVEFPLGPIGTLPIPNLTSDTETGLGRYTDRQIFRMLRHAVKPDGTASLWPLMPFQHMADDDLVAIVSYLRTVAPVRNEVAPPRYTLMGKAVRLITPAFQPVVGQTVPAAAPAEAPTRERGEYLARHVANCYACHTNHDVATMEFIGPDFAGGAEFEPTPGIEGVDPELWYRSPNLTPHPDGVIALKFPTREAWVARFRAGRVLSGSPMHWGPFSRMSDADLEALYVFFTSLEPVEYDTGPSTFRKTE